jgi:putative salt-induced outer membrane protein YdiY
MRGGGRALTAALMLAFAGQAFAGLLLLHNGDRISGELVGVKDGQVRWKSELFGEIWVPQVNVAQMESRGLFEVALDAERHLVDCQVQAVPGRQLLNCAQGIIDLASWRLVRNVSALPLMQRKPWRSDGSVLVSGSSSSGNFDEDALNIDFSVIVRRDIFRHSLTVDYDRRNFEGQRVEDRDRYFYQYDYFFSDRWYYNGTLGFERSRFADLRRRTLLGGGLGHQFYDTEFVRLSLELGPVYVWEQFITGDDREAPFLRGKVDFSWRLTRGGIEFFHRNALLQSLDQGDDWELETETGLKVPVYGGVKAQLRLEYDYDNLPSEDAEPEERIWSVGLGYDW